MLRVFGPSKKQVSILRGAGLEIRLNYAYTRWLPTIIHRILFGYYITGKAGSYGTFYTWKSIREFVVELRMGNIDITAKKDMWRSPLWRSYYGPLGEGKP